ncbi:MAG: hypothetical protein ACJ754_06950 [Pyrinomonadaceae bacterium]
MTDARAPESGPDPVGGGAVARETKQPEPPLPPGPAAGANLPDTIKDRVVSVGEPLNSGKDLDSYERLEDIRNRGKKLRTVLKAWETQQSEERGLRRFYAKGLLVALFAQILFVNAAFFAIGLGYLTVDKWVATTFIMAVFAEIVALVTVVNKYLFPKVGAEVLDLIEKM